jgi:acyl-CoA synthetase (AMP-forming)/AMP-acid ligase II
MEWLIDRMNRWRDRTALVRNDHTHSYGEILEAVENWRIEMTRHGLSAGSVVAVQGDYTLQAVALLLALIERGAIVVPLTDAARVHRNEFLEIAEVGTEVAFTADDAWTVEQRPVRVANPLTLQLRRAGDPGLVLFSSGSTGASKAALHNFARLLEKFKVERHRMVTLTFLLLDHIGGINTLLYTLSNGGTVVSVQNRDPDVVLAAVERHRVELLPTSPTFLNLMLISNAYSRHDLSSLRLITYGTEVMPEATLTRMHALFPDIRLQQTYGLSEVGILRSQSKDSGSLWVRLGGEGFKTRVVDGVLWIKADSAMLGYLNAPSPFDAQGWMNTGDLVEVDGDYVRILGRKSEIINVGGQKVYPAEVESVLLQMENVRDAVVVGERHAIMGHLVTARVNLFTDEDSQSFRTRMRAFCAGRLAAYKVPVKVEVMGHDQYNARFKRVRRAAVDASA